MGNATINTLDGGQLAGIIKERKRSGIPPTVCSLAQEECGIITEIFSESKSPTDNNSLEQDFCFVLIPSPQVMLLCGPIQQQCTTQ